VAQRFVGRETLQVGEDAARRARQMLLADAAATGFNGPIRYPRLVK
jgi:hypothetical protein